MASIYKFSGYLIDANGGMDPDMIEYSLEGEGILHHLNVEWEDIGEWEDDNPLNYKNPDLAECEKWFKADAKVETFGRDLPKTGEVWRHFKTGKTVTILAVSQDTENVGSFSVVYKCCAGDENDEKIWHRPLWMFMSKTDKVKYPDANQEFRFEKEEK